uniref:DUF3119 family protein n=1 Tax=Trichocoleus desertorum TaxID=1481672 RepID=UPI0025B5529B
MTATPASTQSTPVVELSPSYVLPVVLVLGAVPLLLVQVWASLAIALLGFFLLFQAATLRLRFTATDLEIHRGETLIRRFPYQDWQNWRIFWPQIPILFYFKEVKSIHFLPILFDAKMLQTCLEQHCSRVDSN